MITELLGPIATQVTDAIASLGYFGVFLAMAIESCLIPLPSELIMPFAGFLVSQGKMNFWAATMAGGFGNLFGSLVAYYLGTIIPEKKILAFLEKYGRFILVSPHEYEKASGWLKTNGAAVSFFSRLLPGIRTVISLPAGVARVNLPQFIGYTLVGSTIWSAFLAYLGVKLGENWEEVGGFLHKFDLVIVIILLLLAGLYIWKKMREFKEK
jgi:membrane protein DedA with SNARE-associated domain